MSSKSLNQKPAEIVYKARKSEGLSQTGFATQFGITQSVVSKYENGQVEIPGTILIHCMNTLNITHDMDVSVQAITQKIQDKLSGPGFIEIRKAISSLIDAYHL